MTPSFPAWLLWQQLNEVIKCRYGANGYQVGDYACFEYSSNNPYLIEQKEEFNMTFSECGSKNNMISIRYLKSLLKDKQPKMFKKIYQFPKKALLEIQGAVLSHRSECLPEESFKRM